MSQIIPFDFNGRSLDVLEIDGQPWFIASHVASILGYANQRDAISKHCKGVAKRDILTAGGMQTFSVIPERDVYRLVMRSRLPSAEKFEEWVVSEVLPSIRQNGGYIDGQESEQDPALIMARALQVAQNVIDAKQRELQQAQTTIIQQKPKVDFYDQVTGSRDAIDIGRAAKVLNIRGLGRNKLFDFLRQQKILQHDNVPYQCHIDAGRFRVVESKYTTPDGEVRISMKTLVYQKGLDYIRRKYQENQEVNW